VPLLFSYGSLQRVDVQIATFGRLLDGTRDELAGWALVPATPGKSSHANVIRATAESRVSGMAFKVLEPELAAVDEYERRDRYVRVAARLASGVDAWVYIDELSLRDPPG